MKPFRAAGEEVAEEEDLDSAGASAFH